MQSANSNIYTGRIMVSPEGTHRLILGQMLDEDGISQPEASITFDGMAFQRMCDLLGNGWYLL